MLPPRRRVQPDAGSMFEGGLDVGAAAAREHDASRAAGSGGSSRRSGGATRRPRIDSSWFVVRGGAAGADVWIWNVLPWRRARAEAALRRDAADTAPPTYMDGSPKRTARQPLLQDQGFQLPSSFPNVHRLDEWRALGGHPMLQRQEQQVQQLGLQQWQVQVQQQELLDAPQAGEQRQRQRQQQQHGRLAANSAGGVASVNAWDCADQHAGTAAARGSADTDAPAGMLGSRGRGGGIGLLDPCLFGPDGLLLEGAAQQAALQALDADEARAQQQQQQQQQEQQ